jgi:tripartite-type tricarboxylate transporter receptor subunit TctC
LLEAIRKGRIKTYATPGSGSPMNMVGEYYKKETGVDIIQVPYRGNAPAIIALLANEVEIMVTGLYPILPYLESGRVKIIGVASDKRSRLAPEVPTFNELGLSRADFSGWFALLGPKGMNKNQVQTLNKHLNEVLKDRDVISRINSMAYIISGGSPDDMSKSLEKLYYKFQNNIEKFEIKINEN